MKEETILKNEWIKHFNLTAKSNLKYYKIVGCFIIGFELEKIPHCDIIQPYFVLYPLWRENISKCLLGPYISFEILDEKGLQYDFSLKDLIDERYIIFKDCQNYLNFDISKDMHKNDLLNLVNKYHEYSRNSTNPCVQGCLAEIKIHLSAYLNDKALFEDTLNTMNEMYARVDHQVFEYWFGDFEEWKNKLNSVFSNRETVLDKINENIANSKIKERVELLP